MRKIRIYPPLSFELLLAILISACTYPAFFSSPPTATPTCQGQTAQIVLTTPDTDIAIGEPVTISMTLNNTTCGGMGLLRFRLEADPAAAFGTIEAIDYPSGVPGGGSHTVEFQLIPTQAGEVTLTGSVSFEGTTPEGAFYWGGVRNETPLVLTVVDR